MAGMPPRLWNRSTGPLEEPELRCSSPPKARYVGKADSMPRRRALKAVIMASIIVIGYREFPGLRTMDYDADGEVSAAEFAKSLLLPLCVLLLSLTAEEAVIVASTVVALAIELFQQALRLRRMQRVFSFGPAVKVRDLRKESQDDVLAFLQQEYSNTRPNLLEKGFKTTLGNKKSKPVLRRCRSDSHPMPLFGTELKRTMSTSAKFLMAMQRKRRSRTVSESIIDVEAIETRNLETIADRIGDWNLDMFRVSTLTKQPLLFVGFVILDYFSMQVPLDKEKLRNFLRDADAAYMDVPYHSSLHGAAVGRAVYSIIVEGGLGKHLDYPMQFCLVFAGLMHDVAHPGLTSAFVLRDRSEIDKIGLAELYNDQSPLENMHLSTTFQLLKKQDNAFLKDFSDRVRKRLIQAVLATDMNRHAETLTRLDVLIDNWKHPEASGLPWHWPNLPPAHLAKDMQAQYVRDLSEEFIMCAFLHAADLASPTLPFEQFLQWNDRIQEEFYQQGELENAKFGTFLSPKAGFDRDAPKEGLHRFTAFFLEGLVQPLWKSLAELTSIRHADSIAAGVDVSQQISNLEENIRLWKNMDLSLLNSDQCRKM